MKINFHMSLVVIYITLNFKPLKKCMNFWVPSIACLNLTLLYINYRTNVFIPVVRKKDSWYYSTSKNNKLVSSSFSRDSLLVYFSNIYHHFVSLLYSSLSFIFEAYILPSRVNISRVSCLFFKSTYSLREESISVKSN